MTHNDDDNDFSDDGFLSDDRIDEVSGAFFDRFAPEIWLRDRFGDDYRKRFYPKKGASFWIGLLFEPPAVSLGINFKPFTIPEDAISADYCYEILSSIDSLSERVAFYREVCDEDPGVDDAWGNVMIDMKFLARFIPILKVDDHGFFHAPHVYHALDYLPKISDVARLFDTPRGPNVELLQLAG